jgi:hypothetical protein
MLAAARRSNLPTLLSLPLFLYSSCSRPKSSKAGQFLEPNPPATIYENQITSTQDSLTS